MTTKLELGSEVCLVTGVSADTVPVITVNRGYVNTTKSAHPTGTTVKIEPLWTREEVARWVKRAYNVVFNKYLPRKVTDVYTREDDLQYITLPTDTLQVFSVRHMSTVSGRVVDIGQWRWETDIPGELVSTGNLLRVPSTIENDDELIVVYQRPYTWTGTGTEDDTIDQPYGSEDLAPLWASAYAMARREVSRSELDKIEEWNQDQAIRAGVNLRAIRDAWGEFYRRLDEARDLHPVPRHRPYRKMPRSW